MENVVANTDKGALTNPLKKVRLPDLKRSMGDEYSSDAPTIDKQGFVTIWRECCINGVAKEPRSQWSKRRDNECYPNSSNQVPAIGPNVSKQPQENSPVTWWALGIAHHSCHAR